MIYKLEARFRDVYGYEDIFFQKEALDALMPFLEDNMIECMKDETYLWLLRHEIGDENIAYNISKALSSIGSK
jgi:hypothetical protein